MRLEEVLEVNSILIERIDNVVFCFRQQNFDRAIRRFAVVLNMIEKLIINYNQTIVKLSNYEEEYSKESLLNVLANILKAQEDKDYILLSDLLELQVRPFIIRLQEWIIMELDYTLSNFNEEKNLKVILDNDKELYKQLQRKSKSEAEFQCEYTASGLPTVKCNYRGKEFYLHSNNNPHYEAMITANSWYIENKRKYIIYGLGLGYHICQLCEIDSYIVIDVYESSQTILQLAAVYGVLGRCLLSGQVRVHYDPDYTKLAEKISEVDEDTEFVIHEPSQRIIEKETIRDRMEEYFLTTNRLRIKKEY